MGKYAVAVSFITVDDVIGNKIVIVDALDIQEARFKGVEQAKKEIDPYEYCTNPSLRYSQPTASGVDAILIDL